MTSDSNYPNSHQNMPVATPNSNMAIIALIAGILGLTLFPLLGSVVAIITGPMAKREINESGGRIGGENLAHIGMILGWIGLGLSLVGCCIAFGVIGFSIMMAMFGLSTVEFSLVLPAFIFI